MSTLGNPSGDTVTVTSLTSGSGSSGRTTLSAVITILSPEARLTGSSMSSIGSVTLPIRTGESSELVLVTVIVYSTGSPALESSSPVLSIVIDGWNRLTLQLSDSSNMLGNPIGETFTVAVFTSGSGSVSLGM